MTADKTQFHIQGDNSFVKIGDDYFYVAASKAEIARNLDKKDKVKLEPATSEKGNTYYRLTMTPMF